MASPRSLFGFPPIPTPLAKLQLASPAGGSGLASPARYSTISSPCSSKYPYSTISPLKPSQVQRCARSAHRCTPPLLHNVPKVLLLLATPVKGVATFSNIRGIQKKSYPTLRSVSFFTTTTFFCVKLSHKISNSEKSIAKPIKTDTFGLVRLCKFPVSVCQLSPSP